MLLELPLRLSACQDTDLHGTKTQLSHLAKEPRQTHRQTDRRGVGLGPAALSLSSAPQRAAAPLPAAGVSLRPRLSQEVPSPAPPPLARLHGACAPRPPGSHGGRAGGEGAAVTAALPARPLRGRGRVPPPALRAPRLAGQRLRGGGRSRPAPPHPSGGCGDARGGKEPEGRPRRYLRVDVSHREELDVFEHLLRDFQLFLVRRHGAGRPHGASLRRLAPPAARRAEPRGPGPPVPSPAVPPNRASKARAAGRTIPLRDAGVARERWAEPPAPSGSPLRTATSAAAERPLLPLSGCDLRSSLRLRTEVRAGSRARLPPHARKAMVPPETTEAGSGDTRTRPLASRRGEGGGEGRAAPSGPAPLPPGPRPTASAPPGTSRSPPRLLRLRRVRPFPAAGFARGRMAGFGGLLAEQSWLQPRCMHRITLSSSKPLFQLVKSIP